MVGRNWLLRVLAANKRAARAVDAAALGVAERMTLETLNLGPQKAKHRGPATTKNIV